MKFALAIHGTRGDVEPCAAVGLELLRRGHEVRVGVPPDMLGFVESAGLAAVAYGPDSREMHDEDYVHNFWNIQTPIKVVRSGKEYLSRVWPEMGATLASLADGADLLLTGMIQQGLAANVAEHYDIPVAALHCFPVRVNGQLLPMLPSPLTRSAISALWWLHWHMTKVAEDDQRRELGLPKATAPSTQRITEHGSLEIQAYDQVYFPGLAAEWAKWDGQRPFVGALTMELPTDADDEVASWIAAGRPPIYFRRRHRRRGRAGPGAGRRRLRAARAGPGRGSPRPGARLRPGPGQPRRPARRQRRRADRPCRRRRRTDPRLRLLPPAQRRRAAGVNLATTRSRTWGGADFNGIQAPVSLGGTTVTIAGQAAFVEYVSPAQVDVQVPSGVAAGPQPLVVTTAGGSSAAYTITVRETEPGLLAPPAFLIKGTQNVVALFSNTLTYVLPTTVPGATTARAQPGDSLTLYGVGFGRVTPDTPAGQIVQQTNALQSTLQVYFAGIPANVTYAGLTPGYVGLYQFNVVVPNVAASDTVPLTFTLGGTAGSQSLVIAVQN